MHKILTNTWAILAGGIILALLVILTAGPGVVADAWEWWA